MSVLLFLEWVRGIMYAILNLLGDLYENAIYGKDLNDGACADDGCIFRVGGSVCCV